MRSPSTNQSTKYLFSRMFFFSLSYNYFRRGIRRIDPKPKFFPFLHFSFSLSTIINHSTLYIMNRTFKIISFLVVLAFICFAANAQEEKTSTSGTMPNWVSEKGYWVIVRNTNEPGQRTIFFYNNANEEVYKEAIPEKGFKITKRKTLLQIKQILDTALIAWERKQPLTGNERFFVAAKKKK